MESQVIRTYEEAVKITVDFWVEKSFNTKMNQNNGSEGQGGGGIGMMFANLLSLKSQENITKEKIEKFREKLTELLIVGKDKGRYSRECDVDYNPNTILFESCKFAEISMGCLPVKTFTVIENDNSVIGRYQYGGEFFKL